VYNYLTLKKEIIMNLVIVRMYNYFRRCDTYLAKRRGSYVEVTNINEAFGFSSKEEAFNVANKYNPNHVYDYIETRK